MANKHDIPAEKVKLLASFGCSYIEIGKYFGCSEGVIRKRFKMEYEQGKPTNHKSTTPTTWS